MLEKVKNFVSEKKNAIVGAVATAVALVSASPAVFAEGNDAAAYTFTADTFAPITNMITANIPVLLGVVVGILAITIGVPWAIKFIRKFVK